MLDQSWQRDGGGIRSSIIQHHQKRTIAWCQQDCLTQYPASFRALVWLNLTVHNCIYYDNLLQKLIALFYIQGWDTKGKGWHVFTSLHSKQWLTDTKINSAQHLRFPPFMHLKKWRQTRFYTIQFDIRRVNHYNYMELYDSSTNATKGVFMKSRFRLRFTYLGKQSKSQCLKHTAYSGRGSLLSTDDADMMNKWLYTCNIIPIHEANIGNLLSINSSPEW